MSVATTLVLAACGGNGKQAAAGNADSAENDSTVYFWRIYELPQLAVSGEQGVAGALLTLVNGELTIGGGANFPDRPAAEGGAKKVYDDIYTLRGDQWVPGGKLNYPIAYAATASTPEGLAVLGGNDGQHSVHDCFLWQNDGSINALLPLPYPIENAAAAYADGYLYVIGGQTPNGPSREVFRLSMSDLLQWEQLPSLPRHARVQCSAAWLDGRLYVAGGYDPTEGTVDGSLFSWAVGDSAWTFVDSLHKPGEAMTTTLIGGSLLADEPTHKLLFIGGVDATIFQQAISRPQQLEAARKEGNKTLIERLSREAAEYMHHEPEWYQFQKTFVSYSIADSEYAPILSNGSLARAGAAVLKCDSIIYVVNGELKPGIRSNTAVKIIRRH